MLEEEKVIDTATQDMTDTASEEMTDKTTEENSDVKAKVKKEKKAKPDVEAAEQKAKEDNTEEVDVDIVDAAIDEQLTSDEEKKAMSSHTKKRNKAILTIGRKLAAETDLQIEEQDYLDLLRSFKSRTIMTGEIKGIEETEYRNAAGENVKQCVAVVFLGDYKILIPAMQLIPHPQKDDLRFRKDDINKRLSSQIDFVIDRIVPESKLAQGNRVKAMTAKMEKAFFSKTPTGRDWIEVDRIVEARVIQTKSNCATLEIFGVETIVPVEEVSYRRIRGTYEELETGEVVLAKVLKIEKLTIPVEGKRPIHIVNLKVSIKEARKNPKIEAVKKFSVGPLYKGEVSMVNASGVYISLSRDVDCLCPFPSQGPRPISGDKVSIRLRGKDEEKGIIWGRIVRNITHPF